MLQTNKVPINTMMRLIISSHQNMKCLHFDKKNSNGSIITGNHSTRFEECHQHLSDIKVTQGRSTGHHSLVVNSVSGWWSAFVKLSPWSMSAVSAKPATTNGEVEVREHVQLSIPEMIERKRDGHELTRGQIEAFVQGVVSGDVQDSQLGTTSSHYFTILIVISVHNIMPPKLVK